MINTEAKSTLARLLAKENIEVREGNYSTASFDVVNRVLNLPMWKDLGKDVYDLLIGHEVGHALHTPAEGWHDSDIDVEGIPRSYLNIIEDIRIERAIQAQYPGLVGSFKRGYQVLFDQDFFGTREREMDSYRLPDRINIRAKLGDLVEVDFSEEEQPLADMCDSVKTWDDVVVAARALYNFMKEQQEDTPDDQTEDSTAESSPTDFEQSPSQQSENRDDRGEPTDQEDESTSESETDEQSRGEEEIKAEDNDSEVNGFDEERPEDLVETDETFRSREFDLLEKDEDGNQPQIVTPVTLRDAKKAVVGYKQLMESREESFEKYGSQKVVDRITPDYDNFVSENKRVVSSMVREFEMRKAAYSYSRATVSKTGSLDPLKMYSYKYNEDIFARMTKLADAKSHGMVMLVDYSGSMADTIGQVIRQVITLSMFCRKANIPFRVYGFTSGGYTEGEFDTNLDLNSLKIFELLTNEMSKSDYQKAVFQMYCQSWCFIRGAWRYPEYFSPIENMAGTPLNESLLVLNKLIPEFKKMYSLDKVNLTVLTDGCANNMYLSERNGDMSTSYRKISISMNGKRTLINNRFDGTEVILSDLKKVHNLSTINYFIPNNQREFRSQLFMLGVSDEEEQKTRRREFNKQKFTSFDNVFGYDRYFILRAGKDLDTANDDFEVSENANKGEITREFKKFAGSKKGNRVLVTRFAEVIA